MPHSIDPLKKAPRWTINPPHDVARHIIAYVSQHSLTVSGFFIQLARAHMTAGARPECASCKDRLFVQEIITRLAGEITAAASLNQPSTPGEAGQ